MSKSTPIKPSSKPIAVVVSQQAGYMRRAMNSILEEFRGKIHYTDRRNRRIGLNDGTTYVFIDENKQTHGYEFSQVLWASGPLEVYEYARTRIR